ncbi:MAG TPA: hypothetical protein VGS17_10480 [Candidatus Limnocylindria bacterium]|nr:hypothetical protein [Candidatus Limnocylindria bacterium]
MADQDSKPRASDDLETAERKSKTVDERVPTRLDTDLVPKIELPGAIGANVPQGGIGREGPLGGDAPGPGEVALEQEGKAQRSQPPGPSRGC